MPDDRAQEVSVVIDTLINLYTLEPILREISRRGIRQHIFLQEKIRDKINEVLPEVSSDLCALSPLIETHRKSHYLHRVLHKLATRRDFSFQYRLLSDPRQYPTDIRYWIVTQLARLSPGLPHHMVNTLLTQLVGRLVKNPFPTKRVLTASRTSVPHLLCSPDLEVITILESWDHPVKWPVGHKSLAVFLWNDDLVDDWRHYQGDSELHSSYPLKMRCWLEKDFPNRDLSDRKTAIYAAGTSSLSYINELHRYELKVIEAVCEATLSAGWQLLIKPKPNGRLGDFDQYLSRYSHVRLGTYRDVTSTADYYLDDDYNSLRELELAEGDLVINSVTTFALDAALVGLPCLQLDLRQCPEFGGLAEGQSNHHIAHYLLDNSMDCLVARRGQLQEQLAAYLKSPDGREQRQRERLRSWLRPKKLLAESIKEITDRIIADNHKRKL